MSARTQRSQRGRPAPTKKRSSLLPFYVLLAVVVVLGVAFVAWNANRQAAATAPGSTGTSAVDASSLEGFYSKGNADAPVTVIEYADYQCPGCAAYATGLSAEIDRDYVDTGKVRLIYHELPIPSHKNAIPSAEAARAAGEQNKFWEMNQLLYERQQEWAPLTTTQAKAKFSEYAQEFGLDVSAFNSALESGKFRPAIQAAYEAAGRANIQSTPSFVIDGKIYSQTQLKGAIDAALAE